MANEQTELLAELIKEMRSLRVAIESDSKHFGNHNGPLTREAAAEYLGVHPSTLYRWAVEEGRIAYSRLGKGKKASLRFTRNDLDAFLSGERIPAVDDCVDT